MRGDYITGTYNELREHGKTQFITQHVSSDLAERLSAAGVEYTAAA